MTNTARNGRRAGIQRRCLKIIMGGKCRRCKVRKLSVLQFHHKTARGWVAHRQARWIRIRLYMQDWIDGKLELLCARCNKIVGKPDRTRFLTFPLDECFTF